MTTTSTESKKRKLSVLDGDATSSPNSDQVKVTTVKGKNNRINGEDTVTMQTPPTADPNPKLSEFVNLPAPPRQEPARGFEMGELAKLSLLSGPQTSHVIVKIMNHALPQADGAWQYCLKADSIMPGGTGVIWVDENNLQKVNYLDINKGTTVEFMRGNLVMNGVVKEAKPAGRLKDLVYEVEYMCSTVVGMKDILKVTGHGG